MSSGRRDAALVGVGLLVASAVGLVVLSPFGSASIGPDAAAPVIHFRTITSGHHLDAYLGQTPKPLLTVLYGLLWSVTHDWRPIAWVVVAAFAGCVVMSAILGRRIAGPRAAAFIAIGMLFSPVLLQDMALAYADVWALLAWLAAALAVTGRHPRWTLAGVCLAIGSLARLETLLVVGLALAVLVALEGLARLGRCAHPPRAAWLIASGFLALPVLLIHDWFLTGDPLFWAKIAQENSVDAAGIRGPLQITKWLLLHVMGVGPLAVLAAVGLTVLAQRRQWSVALGLVALGPGVAAFLIFLGARGIFVSARYLAPIDLPSW